MDKIHYKILTLVFILVSVFQGYLIVILKSHINTQNNLIVGLEEINQLQDKIIMKGNN